MIDTKELCRLAQAATHPTTKGRWMRLFGERTVYDRLEDGCRGVPIVATDYHPPGPKEAAYLDFIAAANPAAISELLDRLEAAEKERDGLRHCFNEWISKTEWVQRGINAGTISPKYLGIHRADIMTSLLGAAEKARDDVAQQLVQSERGKRKISEECDALRAESDARKALIDVLRAEISALRVKVEQMEQQEPVGKFIQHPSNGLWEQDGYGDNPDARPLYALPGAQPQLNEIKLALQRALELGKRETWTGVRKHRSWEEQREEQQCWNKVWSLLGSQGE